MNAHTGYKWRTAALVLGLEFETLDCCQCVGDRAALLHSILQVQGRGMACITAGPPSVLCVRSTASLLQQTSCPRFTSTEQPSLWQPLTLSCVSCWELAVVSISARMSIS